MVVRLDGVTDWIDVAIPGAEPPVRLSRLHAGADGASVSLVRFPSGWSRPVVGHYAAAEEFVVLDGSIVVGDRFGAGDYAYLPPRTLRAASFSETGALVLAWFSAAPVWHRGRPEEPPRQLPVRSRGVGVLREAAPEVPGGYEVGAPHPAGGLGADVLDPVARAWEWVPAGRAPTIDAAIVHLRTWA